MFLFTKLKYEFRILITRFVCLVITLFSLALEKISGRIDWIIYFLVRDILKLHILDSQYNLFYNITKTNGCHFQNFGSCISLYLWPIEPVHTYPCHYKCARYPHNVSLLHARQIYIQNTRTYAESTHDTCTMWVSCMPVKYIWKLHAHMKYIIRACSLRIYLSGM